MVAYKHMHQHTTETHIYVEKKKSVSSASCLCVSNIAERMLRELEMMTKKEKEIIRNI